MEKSGAVWRNDEVLSFGVVKVLACEGKVLVLRRKVGVIAPGMSFFYCAAFCLECHGCSDCIRTYRAIALMI